MLAMVDQLSVAGSHISAGKAGLVDTVFGSSVPLLPPVTRTFPSASKVALKSFRGPAMELVNRQVGVELVKSMTSAVAVGAVVQFVAYGAQELPPRSNTLPTSYITADPQFRVPNLLLPTTLHAPLPEVSRYLVVWLGPAQNTLPFGATIMNG